ncbi:flagellin [Sporosarcina sp. P34]|uniref:flagellin N-terminal helical domain-containing protein n=1 Tax=Sporosarcina sp. P34 TaxID=2048247 RepID=UPI000C166D5D|nr:flagellin [Sporosarcina sp. P34]PID14419.1 flagellin [Sporosarcina sp. P34]
MRINHNIAALNTHRQLNTASTNQSKSMEKLASGLRINKAGDDAAGLAISEKMRGQIRGLDQASKNAQDGISMIATAEGALNETHDILQRMRELSVQSSNDTNTLDDRKEIQKEVEQLKSEINRISDTTEFNTQKLLNGSLGAVGSSDDNTVVKLETASGLKKGDYTVDVSTAATVKTAAEGTTAFAGAGTDTGLSGKELTINGVTIDFSDMDDESDVDAVKARINSYTDKTGVVAGDGGTTDTISLSTKAFGSDAKIVLGGTDAAEFGDKDTITGGDDAVVTITDENSVAETITGTGQSVSYRGAELTATLASGTDSATITVSNSGATLQIGANKDQNMTIDFNEMSTKTLGDTNVGLVKDINLQTQDGANDSIKTLDKAIQQVSGERSKLGAFQNRLEHSINNLNTSSENLTAAESRIRDVDYALAA